MEYVKKNYILILILLLCAFMRINYDTFVSGYNFDEFAIVSISKLNLIEMLKAIAKEDYHAPLYYFVCHIFSNFQNSEIYLRLLNTLFSVLNAYIFYKIAKLILNKKAGLILAFVFSISHIQITTANFIKFYCFNIFLTSLAIYYFVKYLNSNKYPKKLTVVNILISLSFTYGIAFVFFQYLILFFIKNKKEVIKHFLMSSIGFLIYLPILIIQIKCAFTSLLNAHSGYPNFSFLDFYVFLNDFFTPLTNYSCNTETVESIPLLINSIKSYQNQNFDYISLIAFVFLSAIPVFISILGVFQATIKNQICKVLFYLSCLYLLFIIILVLFEINGFIPIYAYFSGIILIILSVVGLCLIKNKIKYLLLGYIIFSQLIITNVYPVEKRETKTKLFGNIDNEISKIDNKTPIILFDGGRFAKYYYKDKNIISFDYEELSGSHSRKIIEEIYGKNLIKKANKKNIKKLITPIILNEENSKDLDIYLDKILFSKAKENNKIVLIFSSGGHPFIMSKEKIKKELEKDYNYHLPSLSNETILNQNSLGEVIQSNSTKILIKKIEKKYKPIKLEQFLPTIGKTYKKHLEIIPKQASILNIATKPLAGWIFVTYQKI